MTAESQIHVALLNEGVDVWRPVRAVQISPTDFEIVDSPPEDETWEFQSGDRVVVETRQFSDDKEGLVAVRLADE